MLGPLEVRAGSGEIVEVGGARLRALLILLALEPGRVVTTSRLVDALWEEQVPAGATNALQALVSRLRRAVPGIVVAPHPAGYRLDLDPDAIDVRQFERLAARGRAELHNDPAAAASTLRTALALWRGPAFADVAGAAFAREPIARLDGLRLAAIQDRIEAELRLGQAASLVAELEALIVAYPLHEPLVGQLMRALAASGRRGAALAAYEQARERLADQLGTDPSAELAEVHTALLRADPGRTERAAATAATNLRAELTSFVGRDRELAEVGRLTGTSRLTTLTGTGGAGKTRLAVEVARTRLGTMPDGIWLVELAPVSDPGEVVQAVLAVLGLRDQARLSSSRLRATEGPADPLDRLVAALAGKQALLVLDNCEQVIGAAAKVADRILGHCPGVRIIATSREPLAITGEMLWPVGPLSLPPPDADAAAATGYASVRLLADRALAVRPDFRVTDRNVAAVAQICRALDGIPLAIELAAARLRAMAPEEVAARLDNRFRLLTAGSRTALPRHRTLRAVVDWSWELLGEAERALCRRLSIFAGGATLEAAERVCAGGPVAAADVLDLLTVLVDRSLLVVRPDAGGSRYRMLETIRAYGQERLAEAGERDRVRAAHARYFLALAEAAAEHLRDAEQLTWLDRLAADHDNLHAAVRHAVAAADATVAVRLVAALGWYWWLRGHRAEGVELAEAVLALPDLPEDEPLATVYTMSALMAIDGAHDKEPALAWFHRAAELAARFPHSANPLLRLVLPLHQVFAVVEVERRPMPVESIAVPVDDPDPWVAAVSRVMYAHLRLNFGRQHAEAEADFRWALDTFRRLGERWGTAFTLSSLASIVVWRGEYATALAHLEESAELAGALGAAEEQAQFRVQMAKLRWQLGERDRARVELADARHDARRIGLSETKYWVSYTAAELSRLDGDLDLAREALADAVDVVRERFSSPQARAMVASAQGYLAAAAGNLAAARAHHAAAVTAAVESVDAPVIAQILVGLADLAMHENDLPQAATLLGASVAVRGTPDLSQTDEIRVTAAARAALGDAGFDRAYRRGLGTTIETVADLVRDLTAGAVTPGA